MTHTPYLLQIFEMSDEHAHELVSSLLSGLGDISVHPAQSGPDHLLTCVLQDTSRAQALYRLITSVDSRALLIHSSTEPV